MSIQRWTPDGWIDDTEATAQVERELALPRANYREAARIEMELAAMLVPYAQGTCLHCYGKIVGWSADDWSRIVRQPCPYCGAKGW